jgi:O-antigen ligase
LTDDSLRDRESLARLGLIILLGHPLLGVGPANYEQAYVQHVAEVDPTLPVDPPLGQHNGPLQTADETGLFGLGALGALVLVIRLGMSGRRRLASSAAARTQALRVEAAAVALEGYLVTSLFIPNAYSNRYFWILIVLAIVAQRAAQTASASAVADWSWWRKWPGAIIRSYQRATE